jgi:hypothetical protein
VSSCGLVTQMSDAASAGVVSGCVSAPRLRGRFFPGCFGRPLPCLLPVFAVQVLADKPRDQRRLFEAVTRAIRAEALGLVFRKQGGDARKGWHGAISHHAEARRLGFSIQAPRA